MAFRAEEESPLWTDPRLAAESHRAQDFDSLEAFQAWCEETAHWRYVEGLYFLNNSQEDKALEHFQAAADLGSAVAQEILAVCLRKSAFRQAAYLNDAYAQYQLGVMLLWEGHFDESADLFYLSASQGDSEAQLALGVCFEFGMGVQEDLAIAQRYYLLAAQQGNEDASEFLSRVQKKQNAHACSSKQEEGIETADECRGPEENGSKSAPKLAEPVRFYAEI